ncbi:MAG: hypothetical protein AAFW75_03000 [Cyanobacteria bacterium J06636_16]
MGLIKKIFGGIFAFLSGLFGFGKRNGFYMELDEANTPPPSTPAVSATPIAANNGSVAAAAIPKNEKSGGVFKMLGLGQKAEYVDQNAGAVTSQPVAAPESASVQVAQAVAAPAQASTQTATKNSKKRAKKSKGAADATAQATASQPITPQPKQAGAPQVTNFATDYLVNPRVNRSPRRRPGPSISPFKDMAKQVRRQSASMG